jgi:hypothetical protein
MNTRHTSPSPENGPIGVSKQFQPGWYIISYSRILLRFLGNHYCQLCCILRLNDDQGKQGLLESRSVCISVSFVGWATSRLSFIFIVISAYLTATSESLKCHPKCYCATGASWPYFIHEIGLTIAPGAALLLEQRIVVVSAVPDTGGKLKGAVYPILKRCCHSKRMDPLNVTSTETFPSFNLTSELGDGGTSRSPTRFPTSLGLSSADVSDARTCPLPGPRLRGYKPIFFSESSTLRPPPPHGS